MNLVWKQNQLTRTMQTNSWNSERKKCRNFTEEAFQFVLLWGIGEEGSLSDVSFFRLQSTCCTFTANAPEWVLHFRKSGLSDVLTSALSDWLPNPRMPLETVWARLRCSLKNFSSSRSLLTCLALLWRAEPLSTLQWVLNSEFKRLYVIKRILQRDWERTCII